MIKSFAFALILFSFFVSLVNSPAQAFFNRNKCCCEEVVQNNRVIEEKQVQNKKQVVEQETT
jgi:hypothetical protein